jgi:hypothetical protein
MIATGLSSVVGCRLSVVGSPRQWAAETLLSPHLSELLRAQDAGQLQVGWDSTGGAVAPVAVCIRIALVLASPPGVSVFWKLTQAVQMTK